MSQRIFRILDDLKKTIRHRVSQEKTERVAFGVMNRAPYMQFRYTPWIQATPEGEGVYLFYPVWNSPRFRNHSWSGSSE